MSKLLEVNSLTKVFKVSRGLFGSAYHTAVKDVSFSIEQGEIFALVGESGSGKTTIGRIILRLEKPTQGSVKLRGVDIKSMGKEYTKRVGAVFQDPFSSLNPYMNVREIIEEPMIVHGLKDRDERIGKVMDMVRLSEELLQRKPNQLSGGQRQRVAIARAVSLSPDLLVADEPTASLDASVRKEILNLFAELKQMGISTLLITHDIRAVERIADRLGIIYAGTLMELGNKDEVLANPKHPYTKYLLENVPARHPRYRKIDVEENEISEGQNLTGCPFYWLCSERMEGCKENVKEVLSDGRLVKCNLY
ncbi:MAG: ABC transporter ATP-binding protein [Hydrogenobacter sp.]|uniref:ABC transporter ATP-binding protein n=1 Tax=Hydrogenobacter thermophilus TaxID=940 RepID=UPI0030FC310C